ncbi:MAG TPA: hypothetical protein VEG60_00160 [Candidatus Binatia bacterium]|nr:hypothetical protein [Candidatus Binatia bacterium]
MRIVLVPMMAQLIVLFSDFSYDGGLPPALDSKRHGGVGAGLGAAGVCVRAALLVSSLRGERRKLDLGLSQIRGYGGREVPPTIVRERLTMKKGL